MHSPILAEGIRKYKETEEGVEYMCKELRELYDEGIAEGRAEGKAETAVSLAERKMPISDIADVLKVSREQVESWLGLNKLII